MCIALSKYFSVGRFKRYFMFSLQLYCRVLDTRLEGDAPLASKMACFLFLLVKAGAIFENNCK